MKILGPFLVCVMSLAFAACTMPQQVAKGDLYPEMYRDMPKSILVLPAINHTTAADAPNLYSSTVAQPLSNAGFYVFPEEITDRFLANEGLTEGAQLLRVPVRKFKKAFGADAVLYVTINKWDTNYYVVGGNVTVGISYVLKATDTGKTLWRYANTVVMDTSGNSNNDGGLLGAIIATAIKTSTQDYVPIASQINYMALNTIPYGRYHQEFGKDKTTMVYVPTNNATAEAAAKSASKTAAK